MVDLAVVTASLDSQQTHDLWSTWAKTSAKPRPLIHIQGVFGPVAAFSHGIAAARAMGAELVACFHDDLAIASPSWDLEVIDHFREHPRCQVAGFSGASGFASDDIFKAPYSPFQLARQGFMSNMRHAEAHGRRELRAQRVACNDGFSLIGRTAFMQHAYARLESLGIVHHIYDGLLGVWANLGMQPGYPPGECWYLPVECHHHGGMTAVGMPQWEEWAKAKGGDHGVWETAHRAAYDHLKAMYGREMPLRLAAMESEGKLGRGSDR